MTCLFEFLCGCSCAIFHSARSVLCSCAACSPSVFLGHPVLTVITVSSLGFPTFTSLYPVCQRARVLVWCGEGTVRVMSGMWGGHWRRCQCKSAAAGSRKASVLVFRHLNLTFCEHCTETLSEKPTTKSFFESYETRMSLVGIFFQCSRTICLLKQEAKVHTEETLRFLRTNSVWICLLFSPQP